MEGRRTVRSSETLNRSWPHMAGFFHYGRDHCVDGEHKNFRGRVQFFTRERAGDIGPPGVTARTRVTRSAQHARCSAKSAPTRARATVPVILSSQRPGAGVAAGMPPGPFVSDALPVLFGPPWAPSKVNSSLRQACS